MSFQDAALKEASRDIARLLAKTPRAFYFQGLVILTAYREMHAIAKASSNSTLFEPGVFDPRLDEQEADLEAIRPSWEKALNLAIATQDKWRVKTNNINEAFRLAAVAIRNYQQKYHLSPPRGTKELTDCVKAMAEACAKGAAASASLEEMKQTVNKQRAASFVAANTMKVDLVIHNQVITESDVTLSKPTRFTVEPNATMDLMLHRLRVRHQTGTVKARRKAGGATSNHNRKQQSLRSPAPPLDQVQDGTDISGDLASSHIYETWPRDADHFAKIGTSEADNIGGGGARVQRVLPCVWYKRLEDLGVPFLHLVPNRPVVFAISSPDKAKHEVVVFSNLWRLAGTERKAMVLKDPVGSIRLWYEPTLSSGQVPPWDKFLGEAALKYDLAESIRNIRFTYPGDSMSWKTVFVPDVRDPFRKRITPSAATPEPTTKRAEIAQVSHTATRGGHLNAPVPDTNKERRGSLPKLVVPTDSQKAGPQTKTPGAPMTETDASVAKGGWWGSRWSIFTGTVQKLIS